MPEKFLKNGKRNMEYSIKLADQFLDEFAANRFIPRE